MYWHLTGWALHLCEENTGLILRGSPLSRVTTTDVNSLSFLLYWRFCLRLRHSSSLQIHVCCVVFFQRSTCWFQVLPTGLLLVLKSANIYKKNAMALTDLWQVYTAHDYPTDGMGGGCRQFALMQAQPLDWMQACLLFDSFSGIIWNCCFLEVGLTCTFFALKWYELY